MIDVVLGDELIHRGQVALVDLLVEASNESLVLLCCRRKLFVQRGLSTSYSLLAEEVLGRR